MSFMALSGKYSYIVYCTVEKCSRVHCMKEPDKFLLCVCVCVCVYCTVGCLDNVAPPLTHEMITAPIGRKHSAPLVKNFQNPPLLLCVCVRKKKIVVLGSLGH